MAILNGTLVRVYIGGTAVAFATSATINLQSEIDQIAPSSAGAAAFNVIKPRRKTGTININAFYGTSANYDFADLYNAWENGTEITVVFKYDTAGEWQVSGSAYITALSVTAAAEQDATLRGTISFSGATALATIT